MISINIKNNGFIVSGHALFSNYGNDIVCSAVSVTTIGVINEISKYCDESDIKLIMDEEKGYIKFEVNENSLEINTLLKFFSNTITDLEKNYKENIKIIN